MPSEEMRIELWKNRLRQCTLKLAFNIEPAEVLAAGHQAPWKNWRCLNRLRTGTVKTEAHLQSGDFIMARLCVSVVLQMTLQYTSLDTLYFHRSAVEKTFQPSTTLLKNSEVLERLCLDTRNTYIAYTKKRQFEAF